MYCTCAKFVAIFSKPEMNKVSLLLFHLKIRSNDDKHESKNPHFFLSGRKDGGKSLIKKEANNYL